MSKPKTTVYLAPPAFLLFLTFLILKLTGVITWSWWWVTAPLWIGLAASLAILLIVLCFAGFTALAVFLIALFTK